MNNIKGYLSEKYLVFFIFYFLFVSHLILQLIILKKRELQTDINYRTVRVYLHRLFFEKFQTLAK